MKHTRRATDEKKVDISCEDTVQRNVDHLFASLIYGKVPSFESIVGDDLARSESSPMMYPVDIRFASVARASRANIHTREEE